MICVAIPFKCNNSVSTEKKIVFGMRDTMVVGDTLEYDGLRIYENTDSMLFFALKDTIYAAIVPKVDLEHYSNFQLFIDSNPIMNNSIIIYKICDIDMDNNSDSCISKIFLLSQGAYIENSIISNNKKIWFDSLTVTDESLAYLFWGDYDSYIRLKPYTTYKMLLDNFSDFVTDGPDIYSITGLATVSNKIYIWDNKKKKFKQTIPWRPEEI